MTLKNRTVSATHGLKSVVKDSPSELAFAKHLKKSFTNKEIASIYSNYCDGLSDYDLMMRRIIWKALAKKIGHGLKIGVGVRFQHLETLSLGNNVTVGDFVHIQGRHDGKASFGDKCWIGSQSFIDARCLKISENVGLGPSSKILGSVHTGFPINVPIIETDLEIKPIFVDKDADIGVGAIILPGIKIGKGAIVGAGSVVTKSVNAFEIVGGVPARVLKKRKG